MPYTAPTPQDLKARYPEFADVADAAVNFAIQDAQLCVDDSWIERDFAPAILALTAHILATSGVLTGNAAEAALVGPLVSQSLGDASESYATKASVVGIQGLAAELAQTAYGQRFLRMLSSNHPAVALC